ncbi:MAG: c(7)-type cytochrome triheme domain-containing protein [Thermodesulfovibrionales bacterium]
MKKILLAILITVFVTSLSAVYGDSEKRDASVSGGGDIVYTKPVKSVLFSHKLHVEEKGLSCDMCHSGLFEPEALNAQGKMDFNMESLYKGKYCGACHNGKMAFASNIQCARCHIGVKGYNAYKKMGSVRSSISGPKESITIGKGDTAVNYSHDKHKSFRCAECHSGMFPMSKGKTKITMKEIYEGQFCGFCHDGKKAFSSIDCSKCHSVVPAPKSDLTYTTGGIGPVKFSHNFHTKIFKCNDCHTKYFPMKKTKGKMTMDEINKGKYCGTCHNGSIASPASDCGKCHRIG